MRDALCSRRFGGTFAVLAGVAAAFCLVFVGRAGAAETFSNSVTFIGDSVTAGFGYCGTENEVKCKPNEEMANSWFDTVRFGTSLHACA